MTITKILDKDVIFDVERYSYEFEARKSIIMEMLAQDMDTSTAAFKNYQKELVEYKTLFEKAKKVIEDNFVIDVKGWTTWNLDYGSRTLTIETNGDEE